MSDSSENSRRRAQADQQAAAWVLRCDRQLTPAEQDKFFEWIAADPLHGESLARYRRHWNRVSSVAQWRPEFAREPNPDLLAPLALSRRRWAWPLALTAAAAMGAFFFIAQTPAIKRPAAVVSLVAEPPSNHRLLEDGSIIELNRDAEVSVYFTSGERRVRLERGEAHFSVAKNASRPFVVTARGIDVRAVGTAFNVRLEAAVVEVLVTEGRVQVDASEENAGTDLPAAAKPGARPLVYLLAARQRAVVSLLAPSPVEIATLTRSEIDRVLAWQHRLLDFTAAPLTQIVAEFNRRNVVQLVLVDAELGSIRLSASLRSDNLDGFVNLLEAGFGVKAERGDGGQILLRNGPARPH
ncbi:MAG: hypothetical protein RIQ93_3534 [Verrucomicrobiota bacterium]